MTFPAVFFLGGEIQVIHVAAQHELGLSVREPKFRYKCLRFRYIHAYLPAMHTTRPYAAGGFPPGSCCAIKVGKHRGG